MKLNILPVNQGRCIDYVDSGRRVTDSVGLDLNVSAVWLAERRHRMDGYVRDDIPMARDISMQTRRVNSRNCACGDSSMLKLECCVNDMVACRSCDCKNSSFYSINSCSE